jgi:hypothetical protein
MLQVGLIFRKRRPPAGSFRGRIAILAAATAVGPIGVAPALGQDQWIAGDGNWSVPGNWSPGNVPGAGDDVDITFTDGVNRTVNYDYTGAPVTLNSLTVNLTNSIGTSSSVLSMSANALSAVNEYIGDSGSGGGGVGAFDQSGGINTVTAYGLYLGYNSTDTGSYTLSGTGLLVAGQTDFGQEFVGYNGAGVFNQSGGTNSAGFLSLSTNDQSSGTYTLNGNGSLAVGYDEIVGNNGAGDFYQSSGTNSAGTLNLGSTGSYTLSGGTLSIGTLQMSANSALTQTGGTFTAGTIDYSPGATFVIEGGTFSFGTLNQSSGVLIAGGIDSPVPGPLTLGAGGIVLNYNLSGGTFTSATINVNSGGSFNMTGGTIACTTFNLNGGSASFPSIVLDSGVPMITINAPSGPAAPVLNFSSGTIGGNTVYLGEGGGVTTFNQPALLSVSGNEFIGYDGLGFFNQVGGTNAIETSPYLGRDSFSNGNYTLSGGTATVAGNAYVGGSNSASGGTGNLTVNQTGQLSVAGTLKVWNSGTVNLNVPNTTIDNLSIVGNGIINLNGGLTINYGCPANDPIGAVVSYLQSGYNNGT